jgi:endogenous inhibitor of DNA gyrase (YacG/DUF329 family)
MTNDDRSPTGKPAEAPSPSLAPEKPCPICGKPGTERFRPFCSKRCADIDLHRWLSGVYAVPAKDEEEEDGRPEDKGADEG